MISSSRKNNANYITLTAEGLHEARVLARCTQEELAGRTGIAQANLAAMESGTRPIGQISAIRILEALKAHETEYQERMSSACELASEVFERPHLVIMRRTQQTGEVDDE